MDGLLAAGGGVGGTDFVDIIDLPDTTETLLSVVSLRGRELGTGMDCAEVVDRRLLGSAGSCGGVGCVSGTLAAGEAFEGGGGSLAAGGGILAVAGALPADAAAS